MKRKMYCGIYKLENMETGKIYIGASSDCFGRKYRHKYNLISGLGKADIQLDFYKHGLESFKFDILGLYDEDDLPTMERFFYKDFKSMGYSMYAQCENHFSRTHTKDVKRRMGNHGERKELSPTERMEILELLSKGKYTCTYIAQMFDVSATCVQHYKRGLANEKMLTGVV